jgi:ribulose kinase
VDYYKIKEMKNLFKTIFAAVAILAFTGTAKASHNAGGDIQYEYISSTGGTHKYKLIMRLYRDVTGITLPTSATVYACSANYSTVRATLTEITPGT